MASSKDGPFCYCNNETVSGLPKLEVSHPGNILKLCESLTENSTKNLEIKINKYLLNETQSKTVFLINILNTSEEAVVQVINDRIIDPSIRTSLTEDIVEDIVQFKNNPNDSLMKIQQKFNALFKECIEDKLDDIRVFPIVTNARRGPDYTKTNVDVPVYLVCLDHPETEDIFNSRVTQEVFRYCLPICLNTRECEEERRLKKQCQSLLLVARKLFSRLGDLSDLLKEIMSEARRLTNAERCSLFLLDPDHMHLVAKVFDGVSPSENRTEVRIAKDQGIAGQVAASGEILNIRDAYSHPLFYKGMDEATGFKTRNILCFPIRDEDTIVGVAQLCNKIGGNFDYFDEQVANAFSIYCGISIMHSLVYKKIQDAQARSKLSNELMIYHMQVSDQDVADALMCPGPHQHPNILHWNFIPRCILTSERPCYIIQMFEDLNLINLYNIKKDLLARFILYVKKGYRTLPYHNWDHAFAVIHFIYMCIKNFRLIENFYITKLEALALLISALCHDIDHRGTTNSFQQQSNSVLASLYSSEGSVMERHHLSQTLCILNTDGCNFLESLNRQDYILCLDLIKSMILATDLAQHYKIHNKQQIMGTQDGYNREDPKHRYYLTSLLMTCADLSDQTKDWVEAKKVAQMIYSEFFTQGDMERKMGTMPANMMDREKASIPEHQIEFLNKCVLCIFMLLAALFPDAKCLVEAVKKNSLSWEQARQVFQTMSAEGKSSYEILVSEELGTQVALAMANLQSK